jgi:hypothetical protein
MARPSSSRRPVSPNTTPRPALRLEPDRRRAALRSKLVDAYVDDDALVIRDTVIDFFRAAFPQ